MEDFSCEHLLGDLNHYDEREVPYLDFSPLHDNSCTYFPSGILSCCIIPMLNLCRERYLQAKEGSIDVGDTKDLWWQMIQLLPSSYNQTRNVMMNYEVLATIYRQRKDHKLDEWVAFCNWIESLPYSELITGKERFEMKSPVDEYDFVRNIKEEKPKDEYVYVTNEFLLKKYDLEKHRMYKVVFHDEIYKDLIGISIPTCPKEFTLYLCHGQYSYSDPNELKNEPDLVNHPSHYETGKFECIDVMEEALGRDVVKGFCIGNAFKYLYRAKRKNGLEDLKKAQWYLNKVVSMEDEDDTKDPYAEQKARLKKIEEEIYETDKSERFV